MVLWGWSWCCGDCGRGGGDDSRGGGDGGCVGGDGCGSSVVVMMLVLVHECMHT